MLPDCPDDELLDELSTIVTTGWDLPARANRAADVRQLLLLTDAGLSSSFRQAAQQLLLLLDDALRTADDQFLAEDERTGCRILLGVHPAYRSVSSPVHRRENAAELLVPGWRTKPPRALAGTFQRRHQRSALRQVLICLREQFGQAAAQDDDYDVATVSRWYEIDAQRQLAAYGETATYRVRRDGFQRLELLEAELDDDNIVSREFSVEGEDDEPLPVLEMDALDQTKPGFRKRVFKLARSYQAGDLVILSWREAFSFGPQPSDWQRFWVTVTGLNDHFELEMTVQFDPSQLPGACWWFDAELVTDPGEVGPDALEQLIVATSSRTVQHRWSPPVTERRRQYGLNWVWLDTPDDRAEWEAAVGRLDV